MFDVSNSITISDKAKDKLKLLIEESSLNKDKIFLRINVIGGGCSGLSYKMDFYDIINETDNLFEKNEIIVSIDNKSLLYIYNTELDYTDGLNGKGFHFKNPNATRTCGCGESFSV